MIQKLSEPAERYKNNPEDLEALGKIYAYMDSHKLRFNKYSRRDNSMEPVTSNTNMEGDFVEFVNLRTLKLQTWLR